MKRFKVDINNIPEERKKRAVEFDAKFPMFDSFVKRNTASLKQLMIEFKEVAEKENLEMKHKDISWEDSKYKSFEIYIGWVALLDCLQEDYDLVYKCIETILEDYNRQGANFPSIGSLLEMIQKDKSAYIKKYGTPD